MSNTLDMSHQQEVRLDKWLWAARFFKTRTLAKNAIDNGRVLVNTERCKPSRQLSVGDRLIVRTPAFEKTIVITALSDKRGSAKIAAELYQETAESIEKRALIAEQQRLVRHESPSSRPSKKERRDIIRFRDQN